MSKPGNRVQLHVALAGGMALLACLWLAHLPGMTAGLAYLGPGVLVFLLLWLGHYPGERAILAFVRPARRRCARTIEAPRRRNRARMPRGGELLAAALAGRAPPLSAHPL
jgi:hypothetical protein